MADTELDDFINGLRISTGRAQARVTERQQGQLERLCQVDQNGHTERVDWSFVLDVEGATPGETKTIRLPLASMKSLLSPRVTEVSIEMPVEIEEIKAKRPETEPRYTFVVHRRQNFLRRNLHKLKIHLFGAQPGAATVSVDGKVLKTLSTVAPDDANPPPAMPSKPR